MKNWICICLMWMTWGSALAQTHYAVLISANAEWSAVCQIYPKELHHHSPWGDYFFKNISLGNREVQVLFFHGGWGKVAAAGSTQYVISTFQPEVLINLGTCGGFPEVTNLFDVLLVQKTVIYDIYEAMGDSQEAIADYTTTLDLAWLPQPYPTPVKTACLASADKDLQVGDITKLQAQYQAIAGDWETGAIAYTAHRNRRKLLILRAVSDIVGVQGSDLYNNENLFKERCVLVMKQLLDILPQWLDKIENP